MHRSYEIYKPISDSLWCNRVNVRIASISELQRHQAVNQLLTTVLNEHVQIDFFVRRVGSCRRQYNQVSVRTAQMIMQS